MSRTAQNGRAAPAAAILLSTLLLGGPASAQDGAAPAAAPAPPATEGAQPPSLRPAAFSELPGWGTDRQAEVLPALLASCGALRPMRPETPLGGQGEAALRAGTAFAWHGICADMRELARALPRPPRFAPNAPRGPLYRRRMAAWEAERNDIVRAYIEARFEVFAIGAGLMTGYYEPILRGAPAQDEVFRTPLLARPPELVEQPVAGNPLRRRFGMMVEGRLEPFLPRSAIDTGALAGRGLELAWVDDPTDAFFLQIQGSGRVMLPDGQMMRVGYAGQNGQPYVPIGRVLIERGELTRDQMSMQAIRAWLTGVGHDRTNEVLRANPSYVFFRVVDGLTPDQGPIGAMGVPLTPGRSVAVDRTFIPLGTPMFVSVRDPMARRGVEPTGRLVVAQDTGGAIRGPARTDYFWGWGPEAGERAGRMRDEAEVFILLPRADEVATAPQAQ
ncbi:MltA domain-containing protein [Roseomonas sp. HJA6]|uniref:peptidoglycan lytic exotransglycosylase n=1 Tax=Roseomonas alba TaxID=2846776 RepID=A0ABS7A8C6_9PROT|nr:MltA domain-containing protein [Neoroseomonas alba]MBW6398423.1 MltA domain-containing protein [Neoroseomonas alba]